jgi:predicted amidohydrolase YtcJ
MGGLEPGQRADFILVDRDPVTATPHDLARTRVLETWIAGAKAWEAATVTPGERG